jgi:hypothetical protein
MSMRTLDRYTVHKTNHPLVIAGTRPQGICKPDGQTRWATQSVEDGTYRFITYNGWLIDDEITTTDIDMALVIHAEIRNRIDFNA